MIWIVCALALLTVGCDREGEHQLPRVVGRDAGDSGTAVAGNELTVCVDVSHVGDLQRSDLEVIGTGFDADEGHMIRVVATLGEPNYGLGEVLIQNGAFNLYLPGVLGDYTGLAVHVDRVRNDACDPDEEILWQITTGPASALGPEISESNGHAVWEVSPDTLRTFEQAGPCNLNGIFDLTVALPCAD